MFSQAVLIARKLFLKNFFSSEVELYIRFFSLLDKTSESLLYNRYKKGIYFVQMRQMNISDI